jgi:hypothetical protein
LRHLTDFEIARIRLLTENSVDFCLIEPTENGLKKSIMDATFTVRKYLYDQNIHDYSQQLQGPAHRIQINARFVNIGSEKMTVCSLYRPVTKNGDPRIWFSGLPNYSNPSDIIALIAYDGILNVINISQIDIEQALVSDFLNPIKELVGSINRDEYDIAMELLWKIRKIAKLPVPSLLSADTSVGRTLEHALGIPINSSRKPDYKGIELKSYRSKKKNRKKLKRRITSLV